MKMNKDGERKAGRRVEGGDCTKRRRESGEGGEKGKKRKEDARIYFFLWQVRIA